MELNQELILHCLSNPTSLSIYSPYENHHRLHLSALMGDLEWLRWMVWFSQHGALLCQHKMIGINT